MKQKKNLNNQLKLRNKFLIKGVEMTAAETVFFSNFQGLVGLDRRWLIYINFTLSLKTLLDFIKTSQDSLSCLILLPEP